MRLCISSTIILTLCTVIAADRHIVTLRESAPLPVHEHALHSALHRTPFRWSFASRSIRAHNIPTDFVVVCTNHPGVLRLVSGLRGVRSVHRDSPTAARTRAPLGILTTASQDETPRLRLHPFDVGPLWAQGLTGAGVKVAVFDTGVAHDMYTIANLADYTDWTDGAGASVDRDGTGARVGASASARDVVGHGTFVAGTIAGRNPDCPGLAPDASLYVMRIFTAAQLSYTSWFLDAFNYALHVGVHVLNLSVGGPDYADRPFIDKVNELTAAGIIVVSAIGNDGPRWGTLNNPADLLDVVGVGGVEPDGTIAPFSSRGATFLTRTETSHRAYGRVKPDLVAYARNLVAPAHTDVHKCTLLSGTSVASPVVAGAIALIISAVPIERREEVVNPSSIKRALMQSAKLLPSASIYEQGAGLLDVQAAVDVMREIDDEFKAFKKRRKAMESAHAWYGANDTQSWATMKKLLGVDREIPALVDGPRAYLFPDKLDLGAENCRLLWPHCAQPLTPGADWHTVNISVLNLAGVNARVDNVAWVSHSNNHLLEVAVSLPGKFWPWAAGLGVHLRARGQPDQLTLVEGVLRINVVTDLIGAQSAVDLPIRVSVHPQPPKWRRILFDVYHSLRYPPGYVPRDSLTHETKDMLDWLGDHPYTNFGSLFNTLRQAGYFVDIIDSPIACLGDRLGEMYGALLLLDTEDFFFAQERRIIREAVVHHGLALFVAAEWDDPELMNDLKFSDDNTRSRWSPVVGGGNVMALNQLLKPFGIAFGTGAFTGTMSVDGERVKVDSGAPIVSFPKNGEVVSSIMRPMLSKSERKRYRIRVGNKRSPTTRLGHPELQHMLGIAFFGKGSVVALGDTHSFDDACHHDETVPADGTRLFLRLLHHVLRPASSNPRKSLFRESRLLHRPIVAHRNELQATLHDEESFLLFRPHSRVLSPNATVDAQMERDLSKICAQYDELLIPARTESVWNRPHNTHQFSIPLRPHAQLIGSDTRYFKTMSQPVTLRSILPVQATAIETNSYIRTAAWCAMALGILLVSLALCLPAGNRHRRERESKKLAQPTSRHQDSLQLMYSRMSIRRSTGTPLRSRAVRDD